MYRAPVSQYLVKCIPLFALTLFLPGAGADKLCNDLMFLGISNASCLDTRDKNILQDFLPIFHSYQESLVVSESVLCLRLRVEVMLVLEKIGVCVAAGFWFSGTGKVSSIDGVMGSGGVGGREEKVNAGVVSGGVKVKGLGLLELIRTMEET